MATYRESQEQTNLGLHTARQLPLSLSYEITTSREEDVFRTTTSIYFNTTPREQHVNVTTPRVRTRAVKEPHGVQRERRWRGP